MQFVRKGWLESNGRRYRIVVSPRTFDFDGKHGAVRVRDVIVVDHPTLDSTEQQYLRQCTAQIEWNLGMKVDGIDWDD